MNEEIFGLLKTLRQDNEQQYALVTKRIQEIGKPAYETVLEAFQTADFAMRHNLAFLMAQLKNPFFLNALLGSLEDKSKGIQSAAIYALGVLGDSAASAALIKALKHQDEEIRRNAAWALGEIKDPASADALIHALSDSDIYVQEEVIVALGAIQDPCAIEPLKTMLRHSNTRIVEYAFQCLTRNFDCDILDFLIELVKNKHENLPTRRHAVWCLGKLRDNRAFETLRDTAEEDEPFLAPLVIEALSNLEDIRVVPILIPMLQYESSALKIKDCFIQLGSPALEIMIDALDKTEERVRIQLIGIIGEMRDRRALPILLDYLSDKNAGVIVATAIALGKLGDKAATKSLIAILNDDIAGLRKAAAIGLGELGDNNAEEALMISLMDRDIEVRVASARALGKLKTKKAVPLLVEALNQEIRSLKLEAIIALGQIGDKWAAPSLMNCLKQKGSDRKELQSAAAEALRQIAANKAE